MKICIASTPSLNISIKAQKVLAEAGIFSKIVSLEPTMTRRGCAYGLEFACADEQRVRAILRRAGIRPSQFISSEPRNPL